MTQTLQGFPLLVSLERRAWVLKTMQHEYYRWLPQEGISYVKSIEMATLFDSREMAVKEASDICCEFRYTYPIEVGLHKKPDTYEVIEGQDEFLMRYKNHHSSGVPSEPWEITSNAELVRRVLGTKEWIEL